MSFVQRLAEKTVWVLSLGDCLSERALEIGVEESDWPVWGRVGSGLPLDMHLEEAVVPGAESRV